MGLVPATSPIVCADLKTLLNFSSKIIQFKIKFSALPPGCWTKSDFNQGMRSATITEGSARCESTEWYNTLPAESARCVNCYFLLSVFLGKMYVTLPAMR